MKERAAYRKGDSAPVWWIPRATCLLTSHDEYLALSDDESRRSQNYVLLFQRDDDADFLSAVRKATNGGFPLVGDELKARLKMTGYRIERGKPGPRIEPRREEEMIAGALALQAE